MAVEFGMSGYLGRAKRCMSECIDKRARGGSRAARKRRGDRVGGLSQAS